MNICNVRGPHNLGDHSHNRAVCPVGVLLPICCCLSLSTASVVRPGFEPEEVVRHVRSAGSIPRNLGSTNLNLDDGEFLTDTSVTTVAASDDQITPSVAFDGTNYLVVWQDKRNDVLRSDIYGTRVTQAGVVLDPSGIAISKAEYEQKGPCVVFDGTDFLVFWADHRNGWHVYGARVTLDGVVLDSTGFDVSGPVSDPGRIAAAFDGSNSLVVWQDHRSSSWNIYGTRVTPDGAILDTAGIAITTASGQQQAPAIAFGGTDYFVVWQDARSGSWDVRGARVTTAGVVLDTGSIAVCWGDSSQTAPAVASDDSEYLVVWDANRWGDVYGARVTHTGELLDTSGIAISCRFSSEHRPAVVSPGANFLVVWHDYRNYPSGYDIYGARVTPQGVLVDTNGLPVSTAANSQTNTALAFDGTYCLAVWQDNRHGTYADIHAARVTASGSVPDTSSILVSTAANYQRSPAVASGLDDFLVVWEDGRSGTDSAVIYASRVTSAGVVLDPGGIAITAGGDDKRSPDVAFGNTDFLVVWHEYRGSTSYDICGARLGLQGEVLDSVPIVISAAAGSQQKPAASFDGANYIVVWEDRRNGRAIYGARVSPSGAVLDTAGTRISSNQLAYAEGGPDISFGCSSYLVVWENSYLYDWDVWAARVTPQGAVLDTAGICVSLGYEHAYVPAVGFDGTNFLVVISYISTTDNFDVYAHRVNQDGAVVDTQGICLSALPTSESFGALAFDGANTRVVWVDERNGSKDIYGAAVTPAGAVFGLGPEATQAGYQLLPAIACGPGREALLAYQGWTGTVDGRAFNEYRVWCKTDPVPAIGQRHGAIVSDLGPAATIVRGLLCLPLASSVDRVASSVLLDISGRKVMELKSGANDVRALAPGVYFVREAQAQAQAQAIRKVVVTRQ